MKKQFTLSLVRDFSDEFGIVTSIIKSYFLEGGVNIKDEISIDEISKRSIYIFSTITDGKICQECDFKSEICLDYEEEIHNSFFDFDPDSKKNFCNPIYINGKYAGYFCKKRESLILSNWSQNFLVAKDLLLKLTRKIGLTEITEKYEKYMSFPEVEVTIGSDIEFEELNSWNHYSVVPTNFKGNDLNDSIGADGSGEQVEIRPEPSQDVSIHMKNVSRLISIITNDGVPISVKGDVYALGCHIHFGFNFEVVSIVKKNIIKIMEILDDFLGKPFFDLSGDARGDYKLLGSYRFKSYGFEYRSLPSAVVFEPNIFRIVLKVAKNVLEKFLQQGFIEYENEVTEKEYIEVAGLSKEEYEYMVNFVKNYVSYKGEPINFNWISPKLETKIFIRFFDDWKTKNKEFVINLFNEFEYTKTIGIRLYGLRRERGQVIAGFECEGFKTIDHPINADEWTFGLPWYVRMEDNFEDLEKLIFAILETLQKKEVVKCA